MKSIFFLSALGAFTAWLAVLAGFNITLIILCSVLNMLLSLGFAIAIVQESERLDVSKY
jgi:hypothetical protein